MRWRTTRQVVDSAVGDRARPPPAHHRQGRHAAQRVPPHRHQGEVGQDDDGRWWWSRGRSKSRTIRGRWRATFGTHASRSTHASAREGGVRGRLIDAGRHPQAGGQRDGQEHARGREPVGLDADHQVAAHDANNKTLDAEYNGWSRNETAFPTAEVREPSKRKAGAEDGAAAARRPRRAARARARAEQDQARFNVDAASEPQPVRPTASKQSGRPPLRARRARARSAPRRRRRRARPRPRRRRRQPTAPTRTRTPPPRHRAQEEQHHRRRACGRVRAARPRPSPRASSVPRRAGIGAGEGAYAPASSNLRPRRPSS